MITTLTHAGHTAGYAREDWLTMLRNGYQADPNSEALSYLTFQCQGCSKIVTKDDIEDGAEVEG